MTKEETLAAILQAKKAHQFQMQKIEQAILGEKVDNPTALSKKECDFGHWLYGDIETKILLGEQFFHKLDIAHERWHYEYKRIYDIFFANEKKSFFSGIFSKSGISEMERDKAKLYYTELQETTKELLQILAACNRRISALNESKFH